MSGEKSPSTSEDNTEANFEQVIDAIIENLLLGTTPIIYGPYRKLQKLPIKGQSKSIFITTEINTRKRDSETYYTPNGQSSMYSIEEEVHKMIASYEYPEASFTSKVIYLNKYRVGVPEPEPVESWGYYPSRSVPEVFHTDYEKRDDKIKPVTFTFPVGLNILIDELNAAKEHFI